MPPFLRAAFCNDAAAANGGDRDDDNDNDDVDDDDDDVAFLFWNRRTRIELVP